MSAIYTRRKAANAVAMTLALGAALVGLFFLAAVLGTLLYNGVSALHIDLFTKMTPPPGSSGGLLAFEDSASFHGSIVGFDSWSHIDFADISFSSSTTVGYSGNDSSGILQVSDGAHSAQLALIGQYTAASFTLAGDGHGGTMLGAVSGIGTPPVAYDPGTPSPGPSEPLPNTGFLYG